jgi:hypothetical protein
MIKTFGHGLVQTGTIIEPAVTVGVLTGAMVWVLFASLTGLPVSTTHALTGAIVGTGFVAFAGEGMIWSAIGKKIALAGSSDQCNTLWDTVELEGDRDGTYGASGLVCGPESGPVAAMETGAVFERDRPGTRHK